MRPWPVAVALVLLLATTARSGTLVEITQTRNGEETRATLAFRGDAMRAEPHDEGGKSMIFRRSEGVLRIVDRASRTYYELDEGQLEQLAMRMRAARAQMRHRLQQLRPARRRRLRRELDRQDLDLPIEPRTPLSWHEVAPEDRVGDWPCQRYAGHRDGRKRVEVCVAPASELDLDEAAGETFAALRRLTTHLRHLADRIAMVTPFVGSASRPGEQEGDESAVGFPVESIGYGPDGDVEARMRVRSVTEEELEADRFTVPDGFEEQELPLPELPSSR